MSSEGNDNDNDNGVQKVIEAVKKVIDVEKEFEEKMKMFPIVIGNVLQDVNEYKKECERNLKGVIELCNKVKGDIENDKESEEGFKSKVDVFINEINMLNNNVMNNANKELLVYKAMMDYFVLSEKEDEAQHSLKYLLFMFKQSNEMVCDCLRKYNVVSSSSTMQNNSSINNNSLLEIKRLNMQVEQLSQIIQTQEKVINEKNDQKVQPQPSPSKKANNENEYQLKIKELQKANEDLLKQIKSLKEENKQLKLKRGSGASGDNNNNNSSNNTNNNLNTIPQKEIIIHKPKKITPHYVDHSSLMLLNQITAENKKIMKQLEHFNKQQAQVQNNLYQIKQISNNNANSNSNNSKTSRQLNITNNDTSTNNNDIILSPISETGTSTKITFSKKKPKTKLNSSSSSTNLNCRSYIKSKTPIKLSK